MFGGVELAGFQGGYGAEAEHRRLGHAGAQVREGASGPLAHLEGTASFTHHAHTADARHQSRAPPVTVAFAGGDQIVQSVLRGRASREKSRPHYAVQPRDGDGLDLLHQAFDVLNAGAATHQRGAERGEEPSPARQGGCGVGVQRYRPHDPGGVADITGHERGYSLGEPAARTGQCRGLAIGVQGLALGGPSGRSDPIVGNETVGFQPRHDVLAFTAAALGDRRGSSHVLGLPQDLNGVHQRAAGQSPVSPHQQQHRVGLDDCRRQGLDPGVARTGRRSSGLAHEAGHPVPVLGFGKRRQGVLGRPFPLEKQSRTMMLVAGPGRPDGLDQLGVQVGQQHRVVTEGVVVDPLGEEAAAFELGQQLVTSRAIKELVAQSAGGTPEHAGADEKVL